MTDQLSPELGHHYNGKGEQVRRFLGTINTYTLYDEAGHWLGDYYTNGAPKQQVIWLDDLPVGLLANANKLHYIEPDHLGSPRVVVDPARNVAVWSWSLKRETFGNTAPNQDPDGDGAALVLDMRFPGQRFDAASGLNQNYFRDYDAATGRYGQSDPIGLDGGIATYAYVSGNPVGLIDPLGLVKWSGTMTSGSAASGIGGGFYRLSLNSECVNGEQGRAEVVAIGPTIGVEIKGVPPFSLTTSTVTLQDRLNYVNPNVLNGWFSMWSAGITAFGGYGFSMIQVGGDGGSLNPPERSGAYNFLENGPSRGFEIGAGGVAGSATVVDSSISKCGCK
ncbi:RHS repeat-associated protein [Xanthomonas arboricola]|nr:RHS repeat-associated protein [Xanthomonas arboricola]